MNHFLIAWVGRTDLRAPTEEAIVGLGPIGQAVKDRQFDKIILLSNYDKAEVTPYIKWLQGRTRAKVQPRYHTLSSPTEYSEIHAAASRAVIETLERDKEDVTLTFHLSPGTPAMAAVWIILAKTRFPAELIESSREAGVRTVSFPFDISAEFVPSLLRTQDKEIEKLSAGLPPEAPEFEDIAHRSAQMQRLIAMARRVAPHGVPILIEGESGSGKELLARAIVRSSTRRDKPLVSVNCGAIPSELVESELFGHTKGAFTNAAYARAGYFEAANNGTLFLDEVGELPLSAQVKLLRVLQEGEVTRIGSTTTTKVDVRIIAATNRSLANEVSAGRFREDLFFRLAVAVLQIPPLRDREGDIGRLIDQTLNRFGGEASQIRVGNKSLSASARNLLLKHRWPGNVRELQNTLLRAAIWSAENEISADEIRRAMFKSQDDGDKNILQRSLGNGFDLQKLLSEITIHYLRRAMEEAHGNKSEAARLVGLPNYQTLTNWLRRYKID